MDKLKKNLILQRKEEAYSLFKKLSFPKAIKLLNKIISEDKHKDYACFFLLGTSYLHINDLNLAEKNLKISLELNQESYDSIHNLGVVKKLKGEQTEAIDFFLKALKLNSKNLQTLNQLAECYEQNKSFDDAKKYYFKVIEIDQNNKQANKGIARIYLKFGYHKEGLKYLQKSSGLLRFEEKEFKIIT